MKLSRRGFLGLGIGTAVAAIARPDIAVHPVGLDLGFGKAGLDLATIYSNTALSMKEWEDHVIDLLPMMEKEYGRARENDLELRVINGETENA